MFPDSFETARIETTGATIHVRHAGSGPPLLLLHGYPQTHLMWHRVAPRLSERFHVVCADLRGYGDSSKPASSQDHAPYSKRAMARDMVEVMEALGHSEFSAAGHDRGARVVHRLARDYPERVLRASVMDIAPTLHMYESADTRFATGYYHWFFLIQPEPLPERLIGADPDFYLDTKLRHWSAPEATFPDEVIAEYRRCFRNPETIHASCEDYRAAAGIDLEHDRADRDVPVRCPLLVLWGTKGFVNRVYDVLDVWRAHAVRVEGEALDCGHFLAEEAPGAVIERFESFFEAE